MTTWTENQLDAIMDAKEARAGWADLPSAEVAAKLAQEGHAAFKAGAPAATPARAAGLDLPAPRGASETMVLAPRTEPEAPQLPAVAEKAELARPQPAHVGFRSEGAETCDGSDLVIPWLKLNQNVGEGSSDPGKWKLTSEETGLPLRVLSILDVKKGRGALMPYNKPKEAAEMRERFLREFKMAIPNDANVACRSPDRFTPVDQGWGTVAKSCATCPLTEWRTIGGERIPPDCGEEYVVLVQDMETGLPAYWRVRSSAIKPWKNFFTLLLFSAEKAHPLYKPKKEAAPMCAFSFDMTSKETSEHPKHWLPVFGRPRAITDQDDIEAALGLRGAVLARGVAAAEAEGQVPA